MRKVHRAPFAVALAIASVAIGACGAGSAPATSSVASSAAPHGSQTPNVTPAPPASPTPAASTASAPVAGERIAFAVKADGTSQIWSVLPDGSDLRQVTSGDGNHLCAALAPDGHTVAYCGDASGNFEIWTVQQDGTAQSQLTKLGGTALFPDVSSDGTRIVFAGPQGSDQHTEVYVVDAKGEGLKALTSCPDDKSGCANDYPSWSPDGKQIVYIHRDDSAGDTPVNQQVWIMNADGSDAHAVTKGPDPKDQVPDWSPDGASIVYASGPIDNEGIWVVGVDGSKPRQLSGCAPGAASPCADGDDFGPAWSPDGSQIAFLRDYQATGKADRPVFVMKADGTDQHRLTPDPVIAAVPDWR